MKGGGKKKNADKMGFTPVADMITSIGTEFDVLTADSLFGFMITMVVSPTNAEYYGPSIGGTRLSTPITQYLLKLSILNVEQTDLDPITLNRGRAQNKSSETVLNFYKEARLQQRLWQDSIVGGTHPICPDVYNISYDCGGVLFGRQHKSSTIKRKGITKYPQVYDYLFDYHQRDAKVGAIAMEYIPNSRSLHDIVYDADSDAGFKEMALITAGAQVLRLFLDYGIIHTDLHGGNVIVDKSGMSYIIDFGMVFDLNDSIDSRLNDVKESRKQYQATLSQRPNRLEVTMHIIKLVNTCQQIFLELKLVEMIINGRFQMGTLYTELETANLYYQVIEKYIELSRSSSGQMSRATINKQIEKGDIELINDDGLNALLEQEQIDIHGEKSFTHSGDTSASATVPMGLGITRRKKRRAKLKRKKSAKR
jgi:serine/threonine protein kinase